MLRRNVAALLLAGGPSLGSSEIEQRVERLVVAVPDSTGVTVSALASGNSSGRRVLLVHGTPGSASGRQDLLATAARDQRWIAVDRPGFGDSPPADALEEAVASLVACGKEALP